MKTESDVDRIAITGLGLVTSLGCGAPSSLAAIRAGLANFIEHETVLVNDDPFGTELSGAKVARMPEQALPRHVRGVDRAAALLATAIRECTSGLPPRGLEQALVYLSSGIEPGIGRFSDNLASELHDLPMPTPQEYSPGDGELGRCLFFENIIRAAHALQNGTCQLALVGCVDSLCDSSVLETLFEANRLKSGTNPEGIIAGEAAGAVLLELESRGRGRMATIYACLSAWGSAAESDPPTGATPSAARGLTTAFHEAFAQLPGRGAEIDQVVVDLNGERLRSREWALTAARVFPRGHTTRPLEHPADCVGDCGAAMGAVLLATATGLMSREVPPSHIAVATSDDGGARRTLCLDPGAGSDDAAVTHRAPKNRHVVLPTVIEQHVDDAPFLWMLRNRLVAVPRCGLLELARHDERLAAHLDGLLLAGEAGWEMCRDSLWHGGAGDYFVASILAFKSGRDERIALLLDKGSTDPALSKGIGSALGWLTYGEAAPYLAILMADDSPDLRRIGIAASALHRVDPGRQLEFAIYHDDPALKARALKAVGELGRIDLLPALAVHLTHGNDACRFYAAWSAALLGDLNATSVLQEIAVGSTGYRQQAAETAFSLLDRGAARKWHGKLCGTSDTECLAVFGAGASGDPELIPWLIGQMGKTELARPAGEAFTRITGADLSHDGLKAPRPAGFSSGPADDPEDDEVGMVDDDGDLPWPDPESVKNWWRRQSTLFSGEASYLLGKTVSAAHLRQVLRTGSQRHRGAAAVRSALLQPGLPLFESRAPGFRQLKALSSTI